MRKLLSVTWLVLAVGGMPFVHAADEVATDKQDSRSVAGDGKDQKPAEQSGKSGDKQGGGGAEPECN